MGNKSSVSVQKKKLLINGEWVGSQEYSELVSPFSEEVIAEIAVATLEQTDEAIDAAMNARKSMASMPAYQRAEILENLVDLLQERAEEAAEIIAMEAAKPIVTARAEVLRTVETYKFAAEEAKRIHGETLPLDAARGGVNRLAYTVREPIGVIGAITPFNFPMNLVAHKVGPAIASGNTIVLKPAAQTPLSSIFIAELLMEAGLPKGALNVVTGSGRVIGDKIVTDPRVRMITFTGSPEVGIGIRGKAGLKKVTLELGSNAAVIVDKGVNIEKIISRCVTGAFSFQGQVCISLQRAYVHEDVYDEFVERLVQETQKLVMGDPLSEKTDVSALISSNDVKRTLSWIEQAKDAGASILTGGTAQKNILLPTVITEADKALNVSCNEVFAPILVVSKIKTVEEAIELVNDSRFGLQAGIYTNDINTALYAADELYVGGVMINDIPTFRVDNMPYGGVKESGNGREGLKYAIEEMTEMKLVVWNRD
ncbi:aldehyde dehydrogenase [Sporosarcina sp. P12(2017)]|uniref:aldehyde dehydrogenase family protein n=1 Tax=unclassified Sporosarcina TaxID=2647733 RepID=UPI000C1632E7|nr:MULTISPECIES: aldehyde dehydrogenase family protein [unclassified Sporosarcina]PIC57706.1 aldehyde dehydrogenase [Sporosarcina sp. P10]PIC61089.1 aldehyde dehydrogenase [Sporosarcina sp. P12(2017)]